MFDDTQRAAIRYRLGWPSRFYQVMSALEQAMAAVGNDPDATATIIALLADLDTIDCQLKDARTRLTALAAGTIKLPGFNEIASLRAEGRRVVGQIASILGVSVLIDIYSGSARRDNLLLEG